MFSNEAEYVTLKIAIVAFNMRMMTLNERLKRECLSYYDLSYRRLVKEGLKQGYAMNACYTVG